MEHTSKNKLLRAVIGCLLVQLCVGILYLWSVFKQSAIGYFGWDDGSVNLVASFMLFGFCLGSLTGGMVQDRIGPKPVCVAGVSLFGGGILLSSFLPASAPIALFYLTYCLIAGTGTGFAYGAVLSCMQKWFPHKRGFATGLAASAFGLSTVVFSPIISFLLGTLSLPATLRILAAIFLLCFVVDRHTLQVEFADHTLQIFVCIALLESNLCIDVALVFLNSLAECSCNFDDIHCILLL